MSPDLVVALVLALVAVSLPLAVLVGRILDARDAQYARDWDAWCASLPRWDDDASRLPSQRRPGAGS